MHELLILSLILFSTLLAGYIFDRMNLPAVIGQLLVGIILGPAVLNLIIPNELIHIFANLGVIILMFLAGLESDLKLLKKYFTPSMVVAFMGVILPMIVFTILGEILHLSLIESLFLGVIFSATSVSISVEVLKEMNQISSREGITILGAAIIDDIIGVILLSIFSTLIADPNNQSGLQSKGLLVVFSVQILYFIGIYIVIKWLAPFILKMTQKVRLKYSLPIIALIIALVLSGMAESISLSAVTGAFFAGIAVGQTNSIESIDKPIKDLGYFIFIPVFFTSIGLEMSLKGILDHIILFIILTILAILTKLYGAAGGAKWLKFNNHNAMIIGSGMVSRGEVALIVAQVGYSAKLISSSLYSTVIGAIIVTTVLAPFLLRYYLSKQSTK